MHHFIILILKLFMQLFKDNNSFENEMNRGNIEYDANTKIQILNDQFIIYFKTNEVSEQLEIEKYIKQIVKDMKNDYTHYPEKLEILNEIEYSIELESIKPKKIKHLLHKL